MIEHNSNKLLWTVGAIAVVTLLIIGMRTFASSYMQDLSAKLSNPTATYVAMNSKDLLNSQIWNSEDIIAHDDHSLTYQVPATPNRTDTNYYRGDVGLSVRPLMNIEIPYHHTLTEHYQVHITDTDPHSPAIPYVVNISNQYASADLESRASGDDLDNGPRQIVIGDIHYAPSKAWQTVPVNQWLSANISYTNNSSLKGTLVDVTTGGIINLSHSPAKVEYRDFCYEVN